MYTINEGFQCLLTRISEGQEFPDALWAVASRVKGMGTSRAYAELTDMYDHHTGAGF